MHLAFHGIGTPGAEREPGESAYWVDTDVFEAVLDVVASTPGAALSFDDGNASDVEIALPALRRRGLRASFFPVAERIGDAQSVDRAGLRALRDAGMDVGSHGMRHRVWRGLPDHELDVELVEARRVIEAAAGAPVTGAACPLGSYDRRVLARLRQLGYTRVFTSDRTTTRSDAWLQPRYSVTSADTVDDVRAIIGGRPSVSRRLAVTAKVTVKRWR